MTEQLSSMHIRLFIDQHDTLTDFVLSKDICGHDISCALDYREYLCGQSLEMTMRRSYGDVYAKLRPASEEDAFMVYIVWDALRCALARYLDCESEDIDAERCHVVEIAHTEEGTIVTMIILPPKEFTREPHDVNTKKE